MRQSHVENSCLVLALSIFLEDGGLKISELFFLVPNNQDSVSFFLSVEKDLVRKIQNFQLLKRNS